MEAVVPFDDRFAAGGIAPSRQGDSHAPVSTTARRARRYCTKTSGADTDGGAVDEAPVLRGLADYRRHVEGRLVDLLPATLDSQPAFAAVMRDAALSPGKRLRPLMCMAAAADLGGDVLAAADAGCAVEFVHAASLVLDDLPCMDDAAMRRGRPSIHLAHGEDLAVLSSISLLSGAYEVLAGIDRLSFEARMECVLILSSAVGACGLSAGQFADLRGGAAPRGRPEIIAANDLKTGSLFVAAVDLGSVAAGAGMRTRAAMRRFAHTLGIAFQLMDDLLDRTASPALIGKDVGKDAGKSTLDSATTLDAAKGEIGRHVADALEQLAVLVGADCLLAQLVDLIVAQANALCAVGSANAAGEWDARRIAGHRV